MDNRSRDNGSYFVKITKQHGLHHNSDGMGEGVASGIISVAHLLHVLGFKRVGAIFDGDKKTDYENFCAEYTGCGYKAWIIPADDIRDKKHYESPAKTGLLGEDRKTLKPEYENYLNSLFSEMQKYLER
jgi:hypothetical protein